MRLQYGIAVWGEKRATTPPGTPSQRIQFSVFAGIEGTPQYRIYKDGEAAPAWANLPLVGSVYFYDSGNTLDIDLWVVEYKDNVKEFQVAKVYVKDLSEMCFSTSNGYPVIMTELLVTTDVQIRSVIYRNTQFLASEILRKISIDGATYLTTTNEPSYVPPVTMADVNGNSFVFTSKVNIPLATLNGAGYFETFPLVNVRRDSNACIVAQFELVNIQDFDSDFELDYVKQDVSVPGGNDGLIVLEVTGGSGNFGYLWADGPVTANRSGLVAGIYTVTVTDLISEVEHVLEIEILEPAPQAPPSGSILEVPMLNSLQFVVDPLTEIDQDNLQTLDNVLLCKQYHPGFDCTNYFQPVVKNKTVPVQFNSNYPINQVQLMNYETDALVASFVAEIKEQNVGIIADYGITLRAHIGFPDKARVYFNVGTPPIPIVIGVNFQILNNVDGFNGVYTVSDIQTDVALGYQYLVINVAYVAPNPTSAATGRFDASTADYNVWEATLDFATIAEGNYYVLITAYESDLNLKRAFSEPVDVKAFHPDFLFLEGRNVDNGYGDITWTTGFITRLWIPALMYKRNPGGERSTSRNADYSLTKINAKKTRGMIFECYMLPPYLHEKLSVFFDLDSWSINGVAHQSNDAYEEPKYLDRFLLANSSIKIEQASWFRKYNSNDIGTVADTGFITTETGFLKR